MVPTTPQAVIYKLLTDHALALSIVSPMWPIEVVDTPVLNPLPGPRLQVMFMPNTTLTPTVPPGAFTIMQGFLQIMLRWPTRQQGVDRGGIRPREYCGLIEQHFPRGSTFIDATQEIRVDIYRAPWTAEPLIEPDRSDFPISIPYRALVNQ